MLDLDFKKMLTPTSFKLILMLSGSILVNSVFAADLNTKLPAQDDLNPISVDLPAQSLSSSLKQFSTISGRDISFDTNLVKNKSAPAVKGKMSRSEILYKLLSGSNLEATTDGTNTFIKKSSDSKNELQLKAVEVRAKRFYEIGPLPGLGLTKEEIPGNVQSITAKQIKDSRALSIADLLNTQLQSVNVNDYQGNPFQMDVQYRGFTASPQIGTPQGLSVFLDGIRINEPFGDVVNWDMIPMNALSSFDVFPGSNPIFGLGTLGGAFSMKTKSGFDSEGVDAEILTGSFGRKQLQASGGWNNGTVALFGAGNFFLEDGWRENSPSRVNQAFGKASYRGDKLDLNLSTLIVKTDLVGNGLIPNQMYQQDKNGVFTSPDTTENTLFQYQLAANYFVSDTFTVTGQIYRRNSKRDQQGADVYTQQGRATQYRRLNAGEQFTCNFNSTNQYGYKIPDYYVDVLEPDGFGGYLNSTFLDDYFANGAVPNESLLAASSNAKLPDYVVREVELAFNTSQFLTYAQGNATLKPPTYLDGTPYQNPPTLPNGELAYMADPITPYPNPVINPFLPMAYYTEVAGTNPDGSVAYRKYVVMNKPAINIDTCSGSNGDFAIRVPDANGNPIPLDGASPDSLTRREAGVVDGTPNALFTNTQINQIVDGGSVQFNWNLPRHKFMIGASIDSAQATYTSGQMLGLLDANRNAYLAPDQIGPQFAAATQEIRNNDFGGTSTTKSIYFSETWSPVDSWHFTGSARYNATKVHNSIAARSIGTDREISEFLSFPDFYALCPNGVCPEQGYRQPDLTKILNPKESEKFSYYSLNPSLGATWQARENLNLYTNFAQGTRTPSVIELGCAYDGTLIDAGYDNQGNLIKGPRSLVENRFCTLPSTLSGDPYLKQIKAQTVDFGARGKLANGMEWNLGAYRTDLKDDIYMVTFPGNRNFFDTVGNTRRQGLEAGLSGTMGKFRFRLNYSLTDATFQDDFEMSSANNSSADHTLAAIPRREGGFELVANDKIKVKSGNTMPGVPLHNLNANVTYSITDKWTVGLTAVAHSWSYVRGNENNQHKAGVPNYLIYETTDPNTGVVTTERVARQPYTNPGKVPGFAVFNFNTRYQLSSEWSLGLQVNNVFDREYFTAGRLGINPFSPSINGAIGPDGFNHNSSDWLSANFLAPGAPRAAWFSINWQFDPNKN